MTADDRPRIEYLLRDLAPQVLGVVARKHGDFAAAEDAVQEALIAAASQWPSEGVPQNPRGWLYHVALRRLADALRSDAARQRREHGVASQVWADWAFVPPVTADIDVDADDSLILLFMCCHPALTPPTAIALTLRAVGGLTTVEIARAFLVPEATMAQRISRAKQTIKSSAIPFALPSAAERQERVVSVLHTLYLIFSEGYVSSGGPSLQRMDHAAEAIRLARMLRASLPADPEVLGLLALMLLAHARRDARTGARGELIPLDEQDRTKWDRELIAEGTALVEEAFRFANVGTYQLQAAIAALHDEASSVGQTDWPQILALYDRLERLSANPMVALNRVVAAAMVHGARAGLAILGTLEGDERVAGHYRLAAVRAHLHERAGENSEAARWFAAAASRTASIPERDYLLMKAARLH